MAIAQHGKETLRVLWYFFKPYKLRSFGVLLLMVIAGLLESLNLAVLYPIINYGLNVENSQRASVAFEKIIQYFKVTNSFLFFCILLIVITVVAVASKIFYHYCANRLVSIITEDNQKGVFNKFCSAPYQYFVDHQQGDLIYAGTVASLSIPNSVFFLLRIINNTVTCAFFVGMLFVLSWRATALMVAVGIMYLLFIRKIVMRIVRKSAKLMTEANSQKNVVLNEYITGIKPIKAFVTLDYWKKKYDELVEQSVFHNFRVLMVRILPDSFIKFTFFTIIAVFGIVIGLRQPGEFLGMLPLLGTFAAVASRLFPYLNLIGGDIVGLTRNLPNMRIVYDVLATDTGSEIEKGEMALPAFESAITFKDVWYKYKGMKNFLLKDVSFTIEKQKVTAIVGPSGSGKSTIINLLLRLYPVEQGKITVDGNNIEDLKRESYLSKIGFVSQETFIFNGTIRDNIVFGRGGVHEEEIIEAAKLANAHGFIQETENNYDTVVGDSGMKLSGGQCQRIAIARAMLNKPEILILDEATSSLDNVSERAVQGAINKICENTTVLVIAHRLSTVQSADRIIVLENGHVVEEGVHQDLLDNRQKYFELYTS